MKQLILILTVLVFVCCEQPSEKAHQEAAGHTSVNVDSLNALFLAGWNLKDSALVMHTLAPDAVVMNDSMIHTGTEAIAKNWVSGGVKVLSNIKTSSSIKGTSDNIAYEGGTYSLDLTIPNGPILKEKGNYSLVWKKQSDGQWLLTLVHIEDVTMLPDVK